MREERDHQHEAMEKIRVKSLGSNTLKNGTQKQRITKGMEAQQKTDFSSKQEQQTPRSHNDNISKKASITMLENRKISALDIKKNVSN